MPQVIAPAPYPMGAATKEGRLPDIAVFAKAYFNMELTKRQWKLLDDIANGREIRSKPRQMGLLAVKKLVKAYLQEGLHVDGRARMPTYNIPIRPKMRGLSQEGRVLRLIKQPGGAFNFELSRVALKYTSVISGLRKDGHRIVAERQYLKNGRASNTWRYLYVGSK